MGFRTSLKQIGHLSLGYQKDEIIFEKSVAGTYIFEILVDCIVEASVIGAGGGGAGVRSSNACAASAGASGSGFVGEIKLKKGTYQVIVGVGGYANYGLDGNRYGGAGELSSINLNNAVLINSPGGGGGHSWWRSSASPAPLGAMPTVNVEIVKTPTVNCQGKTGTNYNSGPGGASVITGTNYGKGGDTSGWGSNVVAYAGTDGYVKLVYKRKVIINQPTDDSYIWLFGESSYNLEYGNHIFFGKADELNIPSGNYEIKIENLVKTKNVSVELLASLSGSSYGVISVENNTLYAFNVSLSILGIIVRSLESFSIQIGFKRLGDYTGADEW